MPRTDAGALGSKVRLHLDRIRASFISFCGVGLETGDMIAELWKTDALPVILTLVHDVHGTFAPVIHGLSSWRLVILRCTKAQL